MRALCWRLRWAFRTGPFRYRDQRRGATFQLPRNGLFLGVAQLQESGPLEKWNAIPNWPTRYMITSMSHIPLEATGIDDAHWRAIDNVMLDVAKILGGSLELSVATLVPGFGEDSTVVAPRQTVYRA
jgi:hypothetical protein